MAQRLRDYTNELKASSTRYTAGRYLQSLAAGKGFVSNARAFVERQNWLDRDHVIGQLSKAAVDPLTTTSLQLGPVEESFFAALRPREIPLQLDGIRSVPMRTRFLMNGGAVGGPAGEGSTVPVSSQTWTASLVLTPRQNGAIIVTTHELATVASPTASEAIQNDLAAAVADAENRAFLQPGVSGSVLNGQNVIVTAGATLANVDTDLAALVAASPGLLATGNATWVMHPGTATKLGLLRGTGGAAAFPDVGPSGGELLGLPVIASAAAQPSNVASRFIALLDPSSIAFARGWVTLDVSDDASLVMDDAPPAPGAYDAALVARSLWQQDYIGFKAIRTAAWFARPSSQAYSVVGY